MANPQAENGHVDLANEIVEQFCRYRISGEEWLVLWSIIRKTYGWKKKEDRISLSQFAVMTGLKRQTVLRAINKLSSKKIIAVIKKDDSGINIYKFNKNFDEWPPLSKKITLSSKKITPVINKDNQVSSKKIHTKDTITKDKYILLSKEIISYLNEKTQKNFSHKTKSTITYIKARLFEGRTLEDFKTVINNKCSKWLLDPNMIDYLRPSTLFGLKFESYLNEIKHPLAGKVSDTTLRNIETLNAWSPPP